MKKLLLLSLVGLSAQYIQAQAPANYYNTITTQTGTDLKLALKNIISNHTQLSYNGLWNAFKSSDKRLDNGKVWDIYSDVPGGNPAYLYTFGSDQCGNYSGENSCYNREHSWPKSHFNDQAPMYTDLVHLYPTDGYVNGRRSNYAYGEVQTANWTSQNGSKLGPAKSSINYPGANVVFEPIDSFKGDLARTYFYMVTAYANNSNFANWDMSFGTELKPWAVQMLLNWHHLDPVSEKERLRNNAIYTMQGNRNPFIDNPEWADCIWGGICNTSGGNNDTSNTGINNINIALNIQVYPNPTSDKVFVDWKKLSNESVQMIELYSQEGRLINSYKPNVGTTTYTLSIANQAPGMYTLKIYTDDNVGVKKVIKY